MSTAESPETSRSPRVDDEAVLKAVDQAHSRTYNGLPDAKTIAQAMYDVDDISDGAELSRSQTLARLRRLEGSELVCQKNLVSDEAGGVVATWERNDAD